jgi:outer membrane murein-binding lipoprotein Lpp
LDAKRNRARSISSEEGNALEPLDSAKEKIAAHWNKNWFAILVVAILVAVVFSGYLSAQHAQKMTDKYYQRIDALEKKVNEKLSAIEAGDKEAAKQRSELEKRLAVSNAKWDSAVKKYAEVRGKVYPARPKDDKELLMRFSSFGYKAVLR